jgi:hypothetical protein
LYLPMSKRQTRRHRQKEKRKRRWERAQQLRDYGVSLSALRVVFHKGYVAPKRKS